MTYFLSVLILLFLISCNSQPSDGSQSVISTKVALPKTVAEREKHVPTDTSTFSREISFSRIKEKVERGSTLVVHLVIPLCDNDNQGIVPVPRKLGNGMDLTSNLYWGALYGFKTHFRKSQNWKLIQSKKDVSNDILERIVFRYIGSSKAKVLIVADAYRGDRMKACMTDFIHAIAGEKEGYILIGNDSVGIGSNADLLIFNGHNGLMDCHVDLIESTDKKEREVAVIGCVSHEYFRQHLLYARGYPLLMTNYLMAPEAYVAEALIESWLRLEDEKTIRANVGKAYDKYQKCGIKGATNIFRYGW